MESAVAAEDDLHLRPGLAQTPGQQGQNRPGVPGAVAVARAQPGRQRPVATEHVQGRKAVAVVVSVEETTFPHAMHRIVGGVEVQHQTAGRAREGCDEPLHQRPVGVHRRLQRRVRPQLVMVVRVFVSQRQRVHPLPDHRRKRMPATGLAARIGQRLRGPVGQSQHPVGLPQQHRATVGSDRAPGKRGLHEAALAVWKSDGMRITICHGRSPSISA